MKQWNRMHVIKTSNSTITIQVTIPKLILLRSTLVLLNY